MSKKGHHIAQRLYPANQCECCGRSAGECRLERHHIDGNHMNNAPENVRVLCVRCHMSVDGRLAAGSERLRTIGRRAPRIYKGTTCTVEACSLPAKYKGLCNSHYYRARNNGGDPGLTPVREYRRAQ